MLNNNKKIGIWGKGIVGLSVARYLSKFNIKPAFYDEIKTTSGAFNSFCDLDSFLNDIDILIPSPGVPSCKYLNKNKKLKIISELELFSQFYSGQSIAVTGTVGKTTLVMQLSHCLNKIGFYSPSIGNIGNPLLDFIPSNNLTNLPILELSSFQLELPHRYSPTVSIITNISANHLDHHKDFENYKKAKENIYLNQKNSYIIRNFNNNLEIIKQVFKYLDLEFKESLLSDFKFPEHRYEQFLKEDGITYINDSKSTVISSTLYALNQSDKPTILIIGGLSKGVNRKPLFENISKIKNIKKILIFGNEASSLLSFASELKLNYKNFEKLEETVIYAKKIAEFDDLVLFSPAGASFDLFKNYQERGNYFKELVLNDKFKATRGSCS